MKMLDNTFRKMLSFKKPPTFNSSKITWTTVGASTNPIQSLILINFEGQ